MRCAYDGETRLLALIGTSDADRREYRTGILDGVGVFLLFFSPWLSIIKHAIANQTPRVYSLDGTEETKADERGRVEDLGGCVCGQYVAE